MKPSLPGVLLETGLSHPAGVRGLKRRFAEDNIDFSDVAPRRGAWVETLARIGRFPTRNSRTPQGCVG